MDLIIGVLRALEKLDRRLKHILAGSKKATCHVKAYALAGVLLSIVLHASSAIADSGWCIPAQGLQGYTYEIALKGCQKEVASDLSNGWLSIKPCYVSSEGPWDGGHGISGAWSELDQRTDDGAYVGGVVDFWCMNGATPSPDKADGKPPLDNAKGDPINAGTGNVYREDADFAAGQLSVERYYNSDPSAASGPFGPHWRHSYARQLTYTAGSTSGTGTATITGEDGRVTTYILANGVWAGEVDVADALTEQTDANDNPVGWVLNRVDTRSTEQYDATGHLIAIQQNDGFTTTLAYSTASTPATVAPGPGYLITVTDPNQRSLQFVYNSSGLITRMLAPDGAAYTYAYNAAGQLQTVTYPDGSTVSYRYDESGNNGGATATDLLTGVIDETANCYVSYSYNASAKGTNSQFAGGVFSYTLTYNSDGSVDTLDPLGTSRHNTFTTIQGVPYIASSNGVCESCSTTSAWQYDFNGQLIQTTDFNGNVTVYQHDQNNLQTGRTEAAGSAVAKQVQTTWDPNLFVPLERRWLNYSSYVVTKTDWIYNSRGQPLVRCDMDVSGYACAATGSLPAGVRRWSYSYCDTVGAGCPLVGLLLTTTGPRTDLTQTATYSYYLAASAVNCGTPGAACYQAGDLHTVTNAVGQVTTIASYDADGRITRLTDPRGVNTDLTYTPRGWLATRTVNGATTTFTYTPYGAVASVADPDGITTHYTYDAAHRLIQVADALGNSLQYTLDAAGDVTQRQVLDPNGTLHASLTRTFNTLGQLTSVVDGLNHTVFNASASTSYDANGNLLQSSDALGIQRKLGYDALNRLVSTLDNYNGTDTATKNTTTGFTLDSLDRITQVTDPSNLNTLNQYDGLSDLTSQTSPDTGTTTRTFDAAGNVLTRTDAKGITATNTYDALNRLTSTSYPDATQNVTYTYDEGNSVTGCSSAYYTGRLTRIIENSVTTVYCYDAWGRVIQKQQVTAAGTDTTGYSYTAAGRLSGIVYPDGTLVSYARDGDGRIQSVSVTPANGTASTVVSNVTYLPFGPVSGYTLGNGQAIVRTYDANYRLTDLTSPAFNLHVARDAMGDITAIGNAAGANPATETYAYDPLYRLLSVTEASGSVLESVTYNQTGDRLTKTGSGLDAGTYTYNANTHQLNAVGNSAFTVDADGNTTTMTQAGSTYGFGYSGRNRMTVAQIAGATVGSYTYNALGQRIQKIAGGATERYDYNEASQMLGEYGATNRDYIWLDGIPVANVDTSGMTSTIAYVTADQLGTPRAIANSSGTTEWQLPYQGNPWNEVAPTSNGYTYNLGLPGQYFDAETGQMNWGFRTYNSGTGRSPQSDPMGLFGGQWSTYAYGNNSPLNNVDSLGLFLWPWEYPIMINGGTSAEQAQVQAAIDQVFSTPRGQQMLDQIDGPWYEHGDPQTLNIDENGTDEAVPNGGVLDINPDVNIWITTTNGKAQASLARIIAHELGHSLMGARDDGPCRMNNVNQNENPVAQSLGQPLRTAY